MQYLDGMNKTQLMCHRVRTRTGCSASVPRVPAAHMAAAATLSAEAECGCSGSQVTAATGSPAV